MVDLLYQLIEHRARWWIVIIGTGLIALIVLLPTVDDYSAAKDEQSRLYESLAKSQAQLSGLGRFSEIAEQKRAVLKKLEAKALNDESVGQFRNRLVQMVRKSGCQMRRVRLGESGRRRWRQNDDPLTYKAVADAGDETIFDLRSQTLGISLTGSMKTIKEFLSELHKQDAFIHTMNLSLQRSNEGDSAAILELDLLLLDLSTTEKISA